MKDVRLIAFHDCYQWSRTLYRDKENGNKYLCDFPEISEGLLQYLNKGYRITHFSRGDSSVFFVLEHD